MPGPERDGPRSGFHLARYRLDRRYRATLDYVVPRGVALDEFEAWPLRSQEAALAWVAEQDGQVCGRCGTSAWEWDDDPHAYSAVEYMCLGCLAVETKREQVSQTKRKGMHVGLVRRPK